MNWKEIKSKYPKAFEKFQGNKVDDLGCSEVYWDVKTYRNKDGVEFDHLCSFRDESEYYDECGGGIFFQRWLYDFFDTNGINVLIHPEYYADGIAWNWQLLWYMPKEKWLYRDKEMTKLLILHDGTGMYGDNGEYPTREIAETASFTKAFEILESKL